MIRHAATGLLTVLIMAALHLGCSKKDDPVVTEPEIDYSTQKVVGFTIKYPSTLNMHSEAASAAMETISKHLDLLRNYFPYQTLVAIQQSPVWINDNSKDQAIVTYWEDASSLPENEKKKAKNVEIIDIQKLAERLEGLEPGLLTYYFSLLEYDKLTEVQRQKVADAYNNAVSAGLYKNIQRATATGTVTANSPAAESAEKYFAKLSEAYFSQSDFSPVNYEDLETYDPTGFQMMQAVWGPRRIKEYMPVTIRGFTVMINKSDQENTTIQEALGIIDRELKLLNDSIFAEGLAVLKERPIWLSLNDGSAASFHPNKEWLLENGKLPDMAQCVQITNASNFVEWSNSNQPWIVLHELSHYMHFHYFGWENASITAAYNNAVNTGLYHNIKYITESGAVINKLDGYALTNEKEYFAELTESFFAKNDYFPFTRPDLATYDTTGYNLAKNLWKR